VRLKRDKCKDREGRACVRLEKEKYEIKEERV